MAPGICPDCNRAPCRNPKRVLDDCCACSGEVCGDSQCPAIDTIVCERCGRGDREQALLLCDGCDHACHLDCMPTPWTSFPALWFCQRCKRAVIEKRRRTGSVGAALFDPGRSSQPWGSMPQEPRLATGSWLGGLVAGSASWPSQHVAGQRVAQPRNHRSPAMPIAAAKAIAACDSLAGSAGFTKQSVNPDIMRRVDATKSKTCNCRKSRCLKQYCECYREKEWCSNRCNCQDCLNLPGYKRHGKTADSTEAILASLEQRGNNSCTSNRDGESTSMESSVSRTRLRTCTCKRSRCLKKYCECYANLEACNPACQCVDCGNRGKEAEHRILSSKAKRVATANAGKIPRNWNLAQSMEPGRENQQGFNGRQSSSAAHPESPIEDGSNFPGEARDTAVGAQPEASKWDAMRLQTSQLPQRVQVMAAEAFLKGSGIPPSTNILSSQHAVSTAWPYVHAGGTSKAAEAGATPTAECAVSQLKESLQGQPGQE